MPFVLVVPPGVDRTSDRAERKCKPLPPSFRIQRSNLGVWSPALPPGVFISYSLWASISYSHTEDGTSDVRRSSEIIQPVACMPYIEPQPPIETDFFPDEYVLSARQTVWGSILGRKLGHIIITTVEPQPLVYGSEQLSATKCTFWITIEGDPANLHRLRAGSIKVDPVLQIRTYYSGSRLAGTPNKEAVNDNEKIRLHNDVIRLETHTFSSLQWRTRADQLPSPRRGSGNGTQLFGEPRRRSTSSSLFSGSEESARRAGSQSFTTEEDNTPWHALAIVPIKPSLRLQPSFCSDFVATSYVIIVKVSTSGVYTKPSYLSVPLQVAYPCPARRNSGYGSTDSWVLSPSSSEDNVCCSAIDPDIEGHNVGCLSLYYSGCER